MTEIYYFSGTGNSLVVARGLARRLEGRLVPMAAMLSTPKLKTNADVIGIIFPIHNAVVGGVPFIVRDFLAKLENMASAYIFAVCTCGYGSGEALTNVAKLIKSKGGHLAAGYTIKMPFSCPPFTQAEEQQKRFQECDRKLDEICQTVADRVEIKLKTFNPLIKAVIYPLGLYMHYSILKNYRKMAGDPEADFDDAVHMIDHSYSVDENCDGCGICARVCPVSNIEMVDDRPQWRHHCESCLACLVWCPFKAIHGGILTGKSERYHHPEVKLREMLL
ncbi:MAG: EFR1 family ferrodoxin [Syntrophomonadaceae bacterium]